MPSDNPVSDAAEGITKGVLDWSLEKITSFISKLKNKKLAFLENPQTMETVMDQYRSGEGKFYRNYITDKSILPLVMIGLTLRSVEEDEERLHTLRDNVFKKYHAEGLHVAEFVQMGILNRYIGILLEELTSIPEFKNSIEEILKNIEKHTLFVRTTNKKAELIKSADIKIRASSPRIFIISGIKSATKLVSESIDSFKVILKDYEFERVSNNEKEILFFKRKNH